MKKNQYGLGISPQRGEWMAQAEADMWKYLRLAQMHSNGALIDSIQEFARQMAECREESLFYLLRTEPERMLEIARNNPQGASE